MKNYEATQLENLVKAINLWVETGARTDNPFSLEFVAQAKEISEEREMDTRPYAFDGNVVIDGEEPLYIGATFDAMA